MKITLYDRYMSDDLYRILIQDTARQLRIDPSRTTEDELIVLGELATITHSFTPWELELFGRGLGETVSPQEGPWCGMTGKVVEMGLEYCRLRFDHPNELIFIDVVYKIRRTA